MKDKNETPHCEAFKYRATSCARSGIAPAHMCTGQSGLGADRTLICACYTTGYSWDIRQVIAGIDLHWVQLSLKLPPSILSACQHSGRQHRVHQCGPLWAARQLGLHMLLMRSCTCTR